MKEKTTQKVEHLHQEALSLMKKEHFRQIILPILIAALLLLAVFVLAIVASLGKPSIGYKAGQITIIVIIFLCLLIGFLLVFILVKAIEALYALNKALPEYGKKALGGVVQVEEGVRKGADVSVAPIMKAREVNSKVKQVKESIKDRFSSEGK